MVVGLAVALVAVGTPTRNVETYASSLSRLAHHSMRIRGLLRLLFVDESAGSAPLELNVCVLRARQDDRAPIYTANQRWSFI